MRGKLQILFRYKFHFAQPINYYDIIPHLEIALRERLGYMQHDGMVEYIYFSLPKTYNVANFVNIIQTKKVDWDSYSGFSDAAYTDESRTCYKYGYTKNVRPFDYGYITKDTLLSEVYDKSNRHIGNGCRLTDAEIDQLFEPDYLVSFRAKIDQVSQLINDIDSSRRGWYCSDVCM